MLLLVIMANYEQYMILSMLRREIQVTVVMPTQKR